MRTNVKRKKRQTTKQKNQDHRNIAPLSLQLRSYKKIIEKTILLNRNVAVYMNTIYSFSITLILPESYYAHFDSLAERQVVFVGFEIVCEVTF